MIRLRGWLAPVLALLQREERKASDAGMPETMTLRNTAARGDVLPFTNIERVHAPRAHSMDKELRRDLGAERLSGRQWKKLRKAARRGLRDE